MQVSKSDFEEALFVYLAPEQTQYFWEFINSQREFIVRILKHYTVADLRFRDLEWRMEAKVASRSLLNQTVPTVTMKLFLDTEEVAANKSTLNDTLDDPVPQKSRSQEVLLQTDPTNLSHVIDVLEQALEESKTHRTKNFVKTVQQ